MALDSFNPQKLDFYNWFTFILKPNYIVHWWLSLQCYPIISNNICKPLSFERVIVFLMAWGLLNFNTVVWLCYQNKLHQWEIIYLWPRVWYLPIWCLFLNSHVECLKAIFDDLVGCFYWVGLQTNSENTKEMISTQSGFWEGGGGGNNIVK